MKAISPRTHGILDYVTSATAGAAAQLLRFSQPAARAARGWAAGYGALSALTDYPLGVRRTVPFRTHGVLDFAMTPLIPALPWLLGFARDRRARNFFLGLAAISAVVTALTDWQAQPSRS
jgi:hypothetical protein